MRQLEGSRWRLRTWTLKKEVAEVERVGGGVLPEQTQHVVHEDKGVVVDKDNPLVHA